MIEVYRRQQQPAFCMTPNEFKTQARRIDDSGEPSTSKVNYIHSSDSGTWLSVAVVSVGKYLCLELVLRMYMSSPGTGRGNGSPAGVFGAWYYR